MFSFLTDLMGELGAVILGVVPSEITTLLQREVPACKGVGIYLLVEYLGISKETSTVGEAGS